MMSPLVGVEPLALRDEIRPLWVGYGELPLVASLACYFDDSRRFPARKAQGVVAIAGYLSSVPTWDDRFSPAWWRIIQNAPKPISEFKASDCRHQRGEFEGWTREECDDLTKDLISVIIDNSYPDLFAGCGCVIEIPTADSKKLRKKLKGFAHLVCVTSILKVILRWAKTLTGSDTVHLIFDRQPKLQGHIISGFDRLKVAIGAEAGARIRPPQFSESHHLAPLQAADILAYETRKEFEEKHARNPQPVSRALRALVEGRIHFARYYQRGDLLHILKAGMAGDVEKDAMFHGPILYHSPETPHFRIPRASGMSVSEG